MRWLKEETTPLSVNPVASQSPTDGAVVIVRKIKCQQCECNSESSQFYQSMSSCRRSFGYLNFVCLIGSVQIIADFPKAVKRLLKNDILMFRTASSVLHILPIAGLYTFLPKYLESQFRLAAHAANMISGNVMWVNIL